MKSTLRPTKPRGAVLKPMPANFPPTVPPQPPAGPPTLEARTAERQQEARWRRRQRWIGWSLLVAAYIVLAAVVVFVVLRRHGVL